MAELLNKARLDAYYNQVPMWLETELTIEMVEISMIKTADHDVWADGGPLTYTVTVTNSNTNAITAPVFTDTLEFDKVDFVENSVAINGVATTNYAYDQATGILTVNLPDLAAGGTHAVTFQVTKK